jgi:hypothetical protein
MSNALMLCPIPGEAIGRQLIALQQESSTRTRQSRAGDWCNTTGTCDQAGDVARPLHPSRAADDFS